MSSQVRDSLADPDVERGRTIAILLDDLETGGVQHVLLRIGNELSARGHRVVVAVGRPQGPLVEVVPEALELFVLERSTRLRSRTCALRADPLGLPVLLGPVVFPRKESPTLTYLPSLVELLRAERPDALLSATPLMNVEAGLARRRAGVPCRLVVTEHNDLSAGHPLGTGWHGRFLPALSRRTYEDADAVVAVSKGLADELSRRTGLARARITTVYNPVVARDLPDRAREPLDHPWFQSGEPPVVLAAGRPGKAKDFLTLVRAFAQVRRMRPARLVILGRRRRKKHKRVEKRREEILRLAADLGVDDDVEMPGYVPNPLPWMARASVFAVSSAYEGFCNVLVEAMACGCPVVSTDCPSGPSEILDEGRYGPLVPVRDPAALAKAIDSALDAPPDPEWLRSRAAEFSVDRAIDVYESLLTGTPRAAVRDVSL